MQPVVHVPNTKHDLSGLVQSVDCGKQLSLVYWLRGCAQHDLHIVMHTLGEISNFGAHVGWHPVLCAQTAIKYLCSLCLSDAASVTGKPNLHSHIDLLIIGDIVGLVLVPHMPICLRPLLNVLCGGHC